MTEAVDKWERLEQVFRKVVREELQAALTGTGKHVLQQELFAVGLKAKVKLGFERGRWTGVTDEQMEAWREAYGNVNIEAELKRAAAWCVSNPQSAPKSNYSRFLNAWLTKEQNRAAIRSIPVDKRQWAGDQEITCAYCDKRATGTVSGIRHCREHLHDAMDGKKVA